MAHACQASFGRISPLYLCGQHTELNNFHLQSDWTGDEGTSEFIMLAPNLLNNC